MRSDPLLLEPTLEFSEGANLINRRGRASAELLFESLVVRTAPSRASRRLKPDIAKARTRHGAHDKTSLLCIFFLFFFFFFCPGTLDCEREDAPSRLPSKSSWSSSSRKYGTGGPARDSLKVDEDCAVD
jgi:hypothetical protein